MPSQQSPDVKFEIGHVLFIDIVGYSKLLINQQSERLATAVVPIEKDALAGPMPIEILGWLGLCYRPRFLHLGVTVVCNSTRLGDGAGLNAPHASTYGAILSKSGHTNGFKRPRPRPPRAGLGVPHRLVDAA